MNISHKYLINNGLSEQKKKFYEKLTSSYKRASTEYRKKNNTDYFHNKVINWLFSQNEETRMILCSVENKKYTNTIHEAYTYYLQNTTDTIFRIIDDDKPEEDKYKLEVTNLNKPGYSEPNIIKKRNEFNRIQNIFLNNVMFYQCESSVDDINNYSNYFTLNPEFLRNEETFKYNCNELSYNNFLSSPIMTKKEIQNKANAILSFELPNWISNDNNENICKNCSYNNILNDNNDEARTCCCDCKLNYFTLSQYILALIEQVLSIRYLIFYESKNLEEILNSTYLYDLFNKKKLILSYLNNSGIEPTSFYSKFKIADINSKVFYDQNIEDFIKEKKNDVTEEIYSLNEDFSKKLFDKIYDNNVKTASFDSQIIFEDIYDKYKNDKNEFYKYILNMVMFFHINKLYTLDDFFYRLIFEKINEEYSKKICDDLITMEEKPKKKKKKKKKNNKEKEENKKIDKYEKTDNSNNIDENINNDINNHINNAKNNYEIISDDKVKENNDIYKEEIFNFVKKIIIDNLKEKIDKINIKVNENQNSEKKNKNNKKEKGFFLYTPAKKKEKKKKGKNSNNLNKAIKGDNNTSLTNKIKINNDEKKKDISKDSPELRENIKVDNNSINEIENNINEKNENKIISNEKEKNGKSGFILSDNISIQSNINSFTLSSSNSSSTSSDSQNNNKINLKNNIDYIDNNLFVVHQNPMMISYEKFNKLTDDISMFNKESENCLLIIRKIKTEIKYYFESIIKNIYYKNSKIEIYGSSLYQLDIESSDLDLSISTKSKLSLDALVTFLTNNNDNQQYLNINPIYTAAIPIIKLDLDFLKLNNDKINELYQSLINNDYYKICIKYNLYNNFSRIKVDISINSINYRQINFIKKGNSHFPQIKPLIKILKKLLILKNMNNTYKGGMNSFCLYLIIFSYLRMNKSFYVNNNNDFNYGSLLIGFLFHYVMCIDFKYTIINPCLSNPFIISSFPLETIPTIIDPTTMKNAGKSIFKILDIVNSLNEIYRDIFIVIKEDNNDENLIYKLFKKYLENTKQNGEAK